MNHQRFRSTEPKHLRRSSEPGRINDSHSNRLSLSSLSVALYQRIFLMSDKCYLSLFIKEKKHVMQLAFAFAYCRLCKGYAKGYTRGYAVWFFVSFSRKCQVFCSSISGHRTRIKSDTPIAMRGHYSSSVRNHFSLHWRPPQVDIDILLQFLSE